MSAAEYRPATALRQRLGKRVPTEAGEGWWRSNPRLLD